jgi:hypothetical protein
VRRSTPGAPLDPVGEEIEPRHIVLDLIDALQIAVEHDQRFFELVHTAGDGGRAGLTGDDVMRGGHHHEEGGGGDRAGHSVDARIDDEARGKGRRRHRHGDQHDDVEQAKPPGSSIRFRGHGSSLRLWPVPQGICASRQYANDKHK